MRSERFSGDKKPIVLAATVFFIALGVRLIFYFETKNTIWFNTPVMDSLYHHNLVLKILQGEDWMPISYFRAPLYFYFLAGIYYLLGISITSARFVQLLLGAFNCFLLFWLTLHIFKKTRLALVAGIIMAFYGPIIYFEGELLLPVLLIFWDLLFCLAFYQAQNKTHNSTWWLISGLILGFSAITRPNVLIFLPVVLIWSFLKYRNIKPALNGFLLFFLGASLVIAPVTIRNYVIEKDFVLIASQAGMNLYLGNNPQSNGETAIFPQGNPTWNGSYLDSIRLAEQALGRKLKSSEISAYWVKQVLLYIKDQPGHWLRLMLKKTIRFWHGEEIGNNKNIYFSATQSQILSFLIGSGYTWYPFGILAPLAWGGFLFAGGFKKPDYLWIALFILTYSISFIIFFNSARYRIPIIPLLIMFACAFIFWCLDTVRLKEWLTLTKAWVIVGLLLFLFNYRPYETVALNFSQSYIHLGNMYQRVGEPRKAEDSYHKAIKINPDRDDSFYSLAILKFNQRKYLQAKDYITKALMLRPDISDNQMTMGLILVALEDNQGAERYFLRTLELNSLEVKAYLYLGELYFHEKRYEEAEKLLKEFSKNLPRNPLAHYNLGNIYFTTKKYTQAIASFQKAIGLRKNYADAYYMLGLAYFQLKDPEFKPAWRTYLELAPDAKEANLLKERITRF